MLVSGEARASCLIGRFGDLYTKFVPCLEMVAWETIFALHGVDLYGYFSWRGLRLALGRKICMLLRLLAIEQNWLVSVAGAALAQQAGLAMWITWRLRMACWNIAKADTFVRYGLASLSILSGVILGLCLISLKNTIQGIQSSSVFKL
jgi:hypothetical protein